MRTPSSEHSEPIEDVTFDGAAPRTLRGTRFTCTGCGDCCRGYLFGPVSQAYMESIEGRAAELRGVKPELPRDLFERRSSDDSFQLVSVDGHCVFLDEENRCPIHATLGRELMPRFCKAFPLVRVETGAATLVGVRMECSHYFESLRGEESLGADPLSLAAALDAPVRRRFIGEQIRLDDSSTMSMAGYRSFENAILDATCRPGTTVEHVIAWAVALLNRYVAGAVNGKLADAKVAQCAREPSVIDGMPVKVAFVRALHDIAGVEMRRLSAIDGAWSLVVRNLQAAADVAALRAAQLEGAAPPGVPLAAVPTAASDEFRRLRLENVKRCFFDKFFDRFRTLKTAVHVLAAWDDLAVIGARLAAGAAGATVADVRSLNQHLATWARLLRKQEYQRALARAAAPDLPSVSSRNESPRLE